MGNTCGSHLGAPLKRGSLAATLADTEKVKCHTSASLLVVSRLFWKRAVMYSSGRLTTPYRSSSMTASGGTGHGEHTSNQVTAGEKGRRTLGQLTYAPVPSS